MLAMVGPLGEAPWVRSVLSRLAKGTARTSMLTPGWSFA